MNRVAVLSLVLILAGMALATVGIAFVSLPAGLIVGGSFVAAFGFAALRGSRP